MSAIVIGDYTVGPAATSSLLTGLVAFWKLEEASGTRNDSAGSNHLADNNTVTQAAGKVGNAAQFTATNNEWLSIASNAAVQFGDAEWTIAGWAYFDGTAAIIIGKDNSTSGQREFYIQMTVDNMRAAVFTATDSEQLVYATNFGALSISTWYFWVVSYSAGTNTFSISVNAGTPDTLSVGPLQAASDGEFRIGSRQYTGFEGYLNGRVDAVGKWNRVLTIDERTALYNGGAGIEYPFS